MNRRATSLLLSILLLFGYVPENKPIIWFAAIPATMSWGAIAFTTLDVGAKFAAIYIVGKKIVNRNKQAEMIVEAAAAKLAESAASAEVEVAKTVAQTATQQAETTATQQATNAAATVVKEVAKPEVVAVLAAADVAQAVIPKQNNAITLLKISQLEEAQKFLKAALKDKKVQPFYRRLLPKKQLGTLVTQSKTFVGYVGPYVPYVGAALTVYGAYSNAQTIREAAEEFFGSGSKSTSETTSDDHARRRLSKPADDAQLPSKLEQPKGCGGNTPELDKTNGCGETPEKQRTLETEKTKDHNAKDNTKDKTPEKQPERDTGAQAPGKPREEDGFVSAKNWDGKKVKHPKNGKVGWPDKDGNIWVPTGPGPQAHGGAHWDVQHPNGKAYDNIYPGGKIRPGRK